LKKRNAVESLRQEVGAKAKELQLVEQTKTQIQDALNEKIKEYMVVE
jgi:hypothetical protein